MKLLPILGISRGNEFSPNHVSNDAAIFNNVVENLLKLGCKVDFCREKDFVKREMTEKVIFSMARDKITLSRLKNLENEGCLIINSAYGIDNCVRKPMTELLLENSIPHPISYILSTDTYTLTELSYPCWIKRGDSHAMVKEDVCYVTSPDEAQNVLTDFRTRGIPSAVVNEHLQGDLIKFYGVRGTSFFYWFYPSPCSHSKFGLEKINGIAKGFSFDEKELVSHCEHASIALNVPVYGGDCIISSDGRIRIIDFNDWPSFARCREEAGKSIAIYIYKQAEIKMAK